MVHHAPFASRGSVSQSVLTPCDMAKNCLVAVLSAANCKLSSLVCCSKSDMLCLIKATHASFLSSFSALLYWSFIVTGAQKNPILQCLSEAEHLSSQKLCLPAQVPSKAKCGSSLMCGSSQRLRLQLLHKTELCPASLTHNRTETVILTTAAALTAGKVSEGDQVWAIFTELQGQMGRTCPGLSKEVHNEYKIKL